jgi:hypothetical protein
VYTSSAPLSLPGGLKNPRIRPFMSAAYAGTIPAEILPLEPEEERAIVGSMLAELNEKFCVGLDPNPSLDRSTPPSLTVHNAGRTVFIGGSNLGRIAKAAAENGHMIVDLTVKGWIPKSGNIGKLCEKLKKLSLTEIDTVVIDSMSNSAFLGTDDDGLPIPAEKSEEDGRYHLSGDIQLAPPSAFKNTITLVDMIISNTGEAKIVLTVPLPRYVLVACCDDTSHVSNRQDPEFLRELSGSEKFLSDAAAAGKGTAEAKILNLLEFFGPLESNPQELTTVDGTSIWAGDGVHLTSNAARVAARKMMAYVIGGETAEPASQQACEAGIGDTGEGHRPAGGQACAACGSAAAEAGAPSALAVRPAAGQPTGKHSPARPAARGTGQQPAERRPAGTDADGPAQGREQGRATRRPPRPMGSLVMSANILCTL